MVRCDTLGANRTGRFAGNVAARGNRGLSRENPTDVQKCGKIRSPVLSGLLCKAHELALTHQVPTKSEIFGFAYKKFDDVLS